MSMQMMLLGAGAVATKPYIDDVFSSYVYTGTGSARSINTGIDMTEGGLVWIKDRSTAYNYSIQDTVRGAGATKKLSSNLSNAENSGDTANHWAGYISSFNNNGFSIDKTGSGAIDWANYNKSGDDYISWTFRKAPGFFDCKVWDGNSTAGRQISHDLGCVPGMVIVKETTGTESWTVYHRGNPNPTTDKLKLESSNDASNNTASWNSTTPTSTYVELGSNSAVNQSGKSYVGYFFAGGESTAATANSASFAADVCYTDSSSNYTLGTSDFTLEYWYKADSNPSSGNSSYIVDYNDDDWATRIQPDGTHQYMVGDTARITSTTSLGEGQWNHIAIVRSSGTSRMYVNGVQEGGTYSDSTDYSFTQFYMGRRYNGTNQLYGKISNLRLVVGTAVYTSSFRPPTEPLTNITNTKLLGLNSSSVTGTTVGTIQISGNTDLSPTASTDSPFDDPAGFKFGDTGDQNVIKCGSYVGNGSSTGPEINLGWEPQWLLIKSASSNDSWLLLDAMRGVVTGGNEASLEPNLSDAEYNSSDWIEFTSTGWKIKGTHDILNGSGNTYIFTAIRRSDGYVGKPVELGSDCFAMDTGSGSSTIPNYDSGFPVDVALWRTPASNNNWNIANRFKPGYFLRTNTTDQELSHSPVKFDSNAGWSTDGNTSSVQSWMWKRHAGFDCIAFQGSSSDPGPSYAHGLGKIPELKIIKRRNASSTGWITTGTVLSQAIAGNNNSKDYYLYLNSTAAATNSSNYWSGNDTATHFTVRHGNGEAGGSADPYLCLLFASVDGISKVGSYSGNGSTGQTISTGFAPRFVMIRKYNDAAHWLVLDTTRGWGSGDDKYILLNSSGAQGDYEVGAPTSNGFTLVGDNDYNNSSGEYIYYAHA